MEMQLATLRTKMEKSNSKAEAMQQTVEDLQRQLTIKEGELTQAGRLWCYLVFPQLPLLLFQ